MPGLMPGHVAKGYVIRKVEDTLNDRPKRDEFLRRLKARKADGSFAETLVEIFDDKKLFDLRPADIRHLRRDWFDRKGGYWPKNQPIDVTVRHGFILCIEVANQTGNAHLPIDVLWICGPYDVELTTCVGRGQLTLIVLTPGVPITDRLPESYDDFKTVDPIYTARPTKRGPGEVEVKLDEDDIEFVQPKAERV
jgi:hypothetical protein